VRTFTINGKPFEFDETKRYLDFYLVRGERNLVDMNAAWPTTLEALACSPGSIHLFIAELVMLDRWIREAPRKRAYRKVVLAGFTVVSGEYWFEDRDDGEAIIDALENSGKLARRILEELAPDVARACQTQKLHPASSMYVGPL
jgi:hypothetical protein